MKTNIMILNVMRYENDKGVGTRISYVTCSKDNFVKNDNFRGYVQINSFYGGEYAFKAITDDFIGKTCEATFVSKPDYKNPLKETKYLESVNLNGNIISLVQPKQE